MALTRITKGVIKPNENYDTHNINSTGIVTAIGLDINGNGDISGNLSVGGVLTYEDVTSIDSVGIITARQGIDCDGDLDVDGHTNLDNVSVAGVTTFTGVVYTENNLGIRKPVPGAPLHVLSPATGGGNIAYFDDSGSGVTGRLMILTTDGATGGGIKFQTVNKKYTHFGPGTNKLTIDNNNSRVGINSSIPSTTLDVQGSQKITGDLDVDGHANLDNVSIAGVVTATDLTVEKSGNLSVNIKSTGGYGALEVGGTSTGYIDIKKPFSADYDLRLMHDGSNSYITSADKPLHFDAYSYKGINIGALGQTDLRYAGNVKLKTETGGVSVTGILTATSFSGDGSSLSNLPAGAPVGGASTNTVFFENDKAVGVGYSITSGKNAMSAGPLTINAGIAVTVPSGSSWTIV